MIKVVLDTNILVSALLNPYGPSSQILNLVLSGDIRLCLDERIYCEYRQVLLRDKFGFDRGDVKDLLDFIEGDGLNVMAKVLSVKWTDPADAKFLEVVIAADAGYLVTGNLKHFPTSKFKSISILSPVRFLTAYSSP